MKRLKVVVSAYTCSPYHGSEPAVGWGFVSALAKHHDLWVIVEEEKWRKHIEHYLEENPEFSEHVTFYFLPKKKNRFLRKLWPPSYYWYYRRWHWDAFKLAEKLHNEVHFDLAHQLTMVSFREPGYLWKMDIPFVWGPVGGMGIFPWRFISSIGIYGAVFYATRNLINNLHIRFLSRPRLAARAAGNGLIAATSDNHDLIQKHYNCNAEIISEVGLPPMVRTTPNVRITDEPIRIIWSGQHKSGKALNLGLKALSMVPSNIKWHLNILGEGPLTQSWKKLTKTLKIHQKVSFSGWLPRNQALKILQSGHVFLITSLKDLTSTVTIEALANGLPVICPDHCGFRDAITPDCGIRVSTQTPRRMIEELSTAILRLEKDEILRQKLAQGALERSKLYDWERKGELMNGIYQNTVDTWHERDG
jgi:glycosyltransferase involved in cell wall biosynthesis